MCVMSGSLKMGILYYRYQSLQGFKALLAKVFYKVKSMAVVPNHCRLSSIYKDILCTPVNDSTLQLYSEWPPLLPNNLQSARIPCLKLTITDNS